VQPELLGNTRKEVTAYAAPVSAAGVSMKGWTRIVSFPVLLAVALAACVYLFDSGSIADPDIWWHLRNAEVLMQTHSVIHHDLYSFTAAGSPWINEAWLGELPYYFGWRWLGIRGIYVVMLLETELILIGVFALSCLTSGNVKSAFLVSSLAVWLATVSFGPRTLLAGWMCLVTELFLLEQFKRGKDWLHWLPPLFILWANLHGSWLIGMVLFWTVFACGLFSGTWGRLETTRWTRPQFRKLVLVGVLGTAGLSLNPYSYHLVFYPFNLAFQQKLNVGHVEEWMSVDFHSIRGKILFAMLAATIALALARRRRWRLDDLAFLLIALYAAITYSRFLFLAAILITPILAKELDFLPRYRPSVDKPWLNLALIVAILAGCIWQFPTESFLQRDTSQNYPTRALQYLREFQPEGRVLNDYLWGGYLIWNVGHIPVFIDSRVDIFEYNGVFADYLDLTQLRNSMGILDKYDIRYVLYRKNSAVAYLLMNSSSWKTRYQDSTTILFERAEKPRMARRISSP
jgi:hypothetical protein